MTIEFDCEGCGVHVVALGRDAAPESGMCSVCEWLSEHVPDPVEMLAVLATLEGEVRPRRGFPTRLQKLGTPISQLSGRPGTPGYAEFVRIAKSWGYD